MDIPSQNLSGKCPLCEKYATIVESHVLPAFIFRWLKETSATGFLRYGENPNKRIQDGIKYRWLCIDCERLLNSFETPFATKIFHPYNTESKLIQRYDAWLLKFCVSVSWRVLRHFQEISGLEGWTPEHRAEAARAVARWRLFLFDEISHPGQYEQHLLPLGPIEKSSISDLPKNINRYFMRGVEIDVCRGEHTALTFAKMGRFALFGVVSPGHDKWKGTRISPKGGVIQPSTYTLPAGLKDYLFDRAHRMAALSASIPEHQQDKIEAAAMKNIDRFSTSDQFDAMRRDEAMFGTEAILRKPKGKN
jgi:hypothetical protein